MSKKCFALFILLTGLNLFFINGVYAQCGSIDFSSNYNKGCLPTLVKFTATGIPSGSTVYWNFGNGKVSGGSTMLETFYNPGTYDIALEVKLPNGTICNINKPAYLVFTTVAEPTFGASDTLLCTKPNSVLLTDSTKNVSKREWYVDGSLVNDTGRTISYTFTSNGYKSVTLKVYDNNGCSKVLTKNNYIHVKEDYVLYFCSRITENSTHNAISATFTPFVDPALTNITEYIWDFPGGTPSTYKGLTPPTVTYTNYSTPHDVTFSVKTKDGCIAKFTKKELIRKYYAVPKNKYCETERGDFSIKVNDYYSIRNLTSNKKLTYLVDSTQSIYSITFGEAGNFDLKFVISYPEAACTDSLILKDLFIVGPARARFKADNPTQCTVPATVNLTALDTLPASGKNTYTWYITDSIGQSISGSPFGPSTNPHLSYTFTNYNIYTVTLIVTNSGGCSATNRIDGLIRIITPTPNIGFRRTQVCTEERVEPLNYSSSKAGYYGFIHTWKFINQEDSQILATSTGRNPVFLFHVPGVYDLEYSIANGEDTNCKVTKIYPAALTVNGVIADYYADKRTGCAPFSTTLHSIIKVNRAGSAGPALKYNWKASPSDGVKFSDPTAANPKIMISTNGCYVITLTITNAVGCSTVISYKDLICLGTVADFTIQEGGCQNQDITVKNTSQLKPDFFSWKVEPSANVTISPSANDSTPTFRFQDEGCYKVKLITGKKADLGCVDSMVKTICIKAPKANFFSDDTLLSCAPRLVQFNSTSLNADSFYWDFGDGYTLLTADSTPIHTYDRNNAKGYNVKLVAIRKYGCRDSITLPNYIKILGPEPSFNVNKKKGCKSLAANFTNTSTGIRNFFMSYGDNSPIDSNTINPHNYVFTDTSLESNTFYPTLYGADDSGCISFYKDTITLYREPVADFYLTQPAVCVNQPVQIINTSKFATKYSWDFNNDGITDDTDKNPVVIFTQTGWKKISLISTTKNGCSMKVVKDSIIYINAAPVSKFIASKTRACAKEAVEFTFTGSSDVAIARYHWNFDDASNNNDTSNLKDPVYTFLTPGKHNIELTVYNKNGCSDTFSQSIITLDTIAPVKPEIYYVTVTEENNVKIVYNTADSEDLGKYNVYQYGNPVTQIYSSSQITDTIAVSTLVNVFARPYCYAVQIEDDCGLKSPSSTQHCSIHLDVSANSSVSNKLKWTPYQGWTNVSAYEIYRKVDNGAFGLHATMGSLDSMFIDSQLCDRMYTYYVRAVHPNGRFFSLSNRDSLRPAYIYQKDPVEIYSTTVAGNAFTYTSWKPSEQPNVRMYVINKYTSGSGWQPNYKITKDNFITDNNVDVQTTSYKYQVSVVDECGNVSPISNPGTSIVLRAAVKDDKRYLSWNKYALWNAGVKEYLVQLKDNNNIFQTIDQVTASDTQYVDDSAYTFIEGPTCYRIMALENAAISSQDTSISNERCAILPARIYIPNAFTPNADGHNDTFKVESLSIFRNSGDADMKFTFRIFNRWGALLFETNDITKGWDGTFHGKESPMDVYIYTVDARGLEGSYFYLDGSFTLIR